jgi:hypothetical protein
MGRCVEAQKVAGGIVMPELVMTPSCMVRTRESKSAAGHGWGLSDVSRKPVFWREWLMFLLGASGLQSF